MTTNTNAAVTVADARALVDALSVAFGGMSQIGAADLGDAVARRCRNGLPPLAGDALLRAAVAVVNDYWDDDYAGETATAACAAYDAALRRMGLVPRR